MKIDKKVEEMRFIIQETQSLSKSKSDRSAFIYCELNLSKDFERSSFRRIPGVWVILREFMIS